MSNVWLTSDLHWGHKNICKYRSEFDTEAEHRRVTKGNILGCLGKRDLLWILGDSVFTADAIKDLMDLKESCGTIKLVLGNHCGQHMTREEYRSFLSLFDAVYGIHKKYDSWLTHAPVHEDELRGSFCVHGHVHTKTVDDYRYVNMCLEEHNYMPRDLRWLRKEFEKRTEENK